MLSVLILIIKGHHFKVNTLVEIPYTSKLEYSKCTGKYEAEGSFQDMLQLLALTLNFSYTITPPPDNKWGAQDEKGNWNGMMKEVVDENIDFGNKFLF